MLHSGSGHTLVENFMSALEVQGLHHVSMQSEHIGQWATPHHLSDVRRDAPSLIWNYIAHSDVTIYV